MMISKCDLDMMGRRAESSVRSKTGYVHWLERRLAEDVLALIAEVERLQEALERERGYEPEPSCDPRTWRPV